MVKNKTSPASSPDMDPGIWTHLPRELLERVLSFLPFKSFLALRSTSKHFKSLIFTPSFISQHSSSSSSSSLPSFLLLSHPQCHQYLLFDTNSNTWRAPSLALSPKLLSTAGGLFCFSRPNSSSSFLLHNLLARSSRIITFPEFPFSFELLTLVSASSGYKIFLQSASGSSNAHSFLYDSKIHLWRKFEGFSPILGDVYHREGVLFDGYLYFVTREPFSIMGFNLNTGEWDRLEMVLPDDLAFVRLASDVDDNRLFLLGGIGRNGISRNMKLWELKKGGEGNQNHWVEVESVPELMCKKFGSICYHNYEHIYCFWHQGMICVCCYTWPEILYYKVSRRTWHWLPKCPYVPEKWSCGFKWFSFVPQLSAFV